MREPRARVEDMLAAIDKIERQAQRGRAAFEQDELLQVYIVHYLIILGEAAFKLPESFRARHSQVPWDSLRGMRHILVHDYFRVDLNVVWQVVEGDLPGLKAQLERILGAA